MPKFDLRFMAMPLDAFRQAITEVERLRSLAGVNTVEHQLLDGIRGQLNALEGTLGFRYDDAERTANRFTQMALCGPLHGTDEVGWELHDHISTIEVDITRSLRRFGRNVFWERHVPVIIGLLTLSLALSHAYVDGTLFL